MTALTLKNLSPKLLRSLRAAAIHDRRSLTQEVIYLLDLALHVRAARPQQPAFDVEAQLAAWRRLAGTWRSDVEPAVEAERLTAARTPGRKVEL
jgi:hypothetical protein